MHILIVEDEPIIAQRLTRFVNQILEDKLTKLHWIDTIDDAEQYLSENTIDLLLLDLNVYGDNGFDLLKTYTAASFHTIVVSAYAEQAIHAFEYGVLDFVAKPFNLERLIQAIERFTSQAQRQDFSGRFLSIKKAGQIELVAIADIDYISASGHYSELYHHENQQKSLHDKSIERLQQLLPANFERIHRSHIVNMNQFKRLIIETGGKYAIELKSGVQLPVGRTHYSRIKQKLAYT